MDENNWWYTCVPTGLPTPTRYVNTLNNPNMNVLKYSSGESKDGKKLFLSIFNYVILRGYTGEYTEQGVTAIKLTDLNSLLKYMSEDALAQSRENILKDGWNNAKAYWEYLKPVEQN